ncbi:hypothetical protein [Leptospira biflexa]|uniref:Uncharacterized protein n=1 Tax=Leptospira biflexa serovar Patoc (strain Patoc 1 / ATCC 23582 / Paris) TaxID=456481 RepID=B0SNK8_LEPBP|nr:hypothetical protein [Leptospira biflexa]ABZ97289.1 Hypothetical protein LEPBI_I1173 [Leptospira biflexa serovar Patoc strain 'Patoc 1 (Paris)']
MERFIKGNISGDENLHQMERFIKGNISFDESLLRCEFSRS